MSLITFQSKHEIDSFSSLVMVSLPFPPLPVLCLRSTESVEAIASGHDLLCSAIASMAMNQEYKHGQDSGDLMQRKQRILLDMNRDVSAIWDLHMKKMTSDKSVSSKDEFVALSDCYNIYCDSFRNYMSCYPGSSDLRIKDHSSVDGNPIFIEQAASHINARHNMFEGEQKECMAKPKKNTKYLALLKWYVVELWTQSIHQPGN